jgi:hypothetical protein
MRIQGRLLRPENLAERRVLIGLGVTCIRVPRRVNPFSVARLVHRLSTGGADMDRLRALTAKRAVPVPVELPDSTSEPRREAEQAA